MATSSTKTLLTTGDIARHCQVTQRTVHNWICRGHLPTSRTPGGHQRVRADDFRTFLQHHRLPTYGGGESAGHGSPARVLVVDDDPEIRRLITRFLLRLGGYETGTADNGFTAGLEVARFRPDVVIMDVAMPHMDGLEACRRIKSDPQARATRVLVLSAHSEASYRDRATACGVDGWLRKPVRLKELAERIAELANLAPDGAPARSACGRPRR